MKFMVRGLRWLAHAVGAMLLVCCAAFVLPCYARIQLPAGAPECVEWGAVNLRDALAAKGITEEQALVAVTFEKRAAPQDEAFSLQKTGTAISLRGGGPVGAMYGLLELAEQVRHSAGTDWAQVAAGIPAVEQRPHLAIRADNVFIHMQPFLLNDMKMWRAYLDMLARNRFNMLDMHGGYDLDTTSFPNLFPLLVSVKEYPEVGNKEEQARNLSDFKAIVAYAKSRGIKVALMNYSAVVRPPRPPGATSPPPSIVPPDKLADYTAKATAELIRQVPDLYEIGFRVGETGLPASFFKDAYLKGIADARAENLRLYTRSWLTTKEQLEPIAQAARSGFDIEIKYNGEQLGLPYHAMHRRYGTYSYEHYLDVPANYGIIWQVRANGTHRFWAWENTDFIRRTVRTFRLGNARGFTLEPHIAYFPVDAARYYRSDEDKRVYDYIWQKHWMWYFAWGRLAYDAELPESTIRQAYADHYGAAGDTIYEAMQASSRIVPLVMAYRFVGADHRDFSPETETGYLENASSIAGDRRIVPEGLLQYALDMPMDDRSFAGIDAWINNRLDTMPVGRLGPFAIVCKATATADLSRAVLWWKPLPSGDFWRSQDMVMNDDGTYTAIVPLTREGLMYLVELQDNAGNARNFPLVLKETPYRIIPPF